MSIRIICGDVIRILATQESDSVQCVVTSPPYWGLRDYGVDGQIGLEPTLDQHIDNLVSVFAEVRRVLRDDGTLWLNLGDSYVGGGRGGQGEKQQSNIGSLTSVKAPCVAYLKPKDLCMVPARVALALQADGWWLRSEIIWAKPNPMPESVTDRPTSAHEKIYLLTKSDRYFYDAEAVKEESVWPPGSREDVSQGGFVGKGANPLGQSAFRAIREKRNMRNVWTIASYPFAEAHFATFPPELVERCIKAGSKKGSLVLDPFGGSGTTGLVADRLERDALLIEINPKYAEMARQRIESDAPLFPIMHFA